MTGMSNTVLSRDDEIEEYSQILPRPAGGARASSVPRPHPPRRAETRPEVVARLEWLDDLMFAAIEGDPVALEAAILAWQKTAEELGVETLEESRVQYLRQAQSVWNALRRQPSQPPQKVLAAIEVISLLAGRYGNHSPLR